MYSKKIECPLCHELTPEGAMIWLNGLCTCKYCYKRRMAEIKEERDKGNGDNLHIQMR